MAKITDIGVLKIPMYLIKFLCIILKFKSWHGVNKYEKTGPVFFIYTNFNKHSQLIMANYFRKLTHKECMVTPCMTKPWPNINDPLKSHRYWLPVSPDLNSCNCFNV